MDRVRLAIVGCGNISQLNAPGYLQHPRCDVVALCDIDSERAKRRAREWSITPRIYTDLAQVLDDRARIPTNDVQTISGQVMDVDPDAMVWRRDRGRNPGGLHYDDGVHKYATATYWIGESGEISAIVTHGADIITETPAAAMWRFKGRDCLGIIDYTYAPEMTIRSRYYRADEFFEIHGSRGIIWVTRCTGEMLDLPPLVVIKGTETTSYQVPTDWRTGFDGAARDFIDGVLEGRQPAQDIRTAKHILQVPLAIYEAARLGRAVAPESVT